MIPISALALLLVGHQQNPLQATDLTELLKGEGRFDHHRTTVAPRAVAGIPASGAAMGIPISTQTSPPCKSRTDAGRKRVSLACRGMRENFPCDQDLDDRDIWPVEHRFTRADQAEMPPGLNITSVFDLAFASFTLREPMPGGIRRPHRRIERGDGVTRYRQVEEQDTEAYREREIQRRARQVVPRPPKAAKAYWGLFADGQQPRPEPKPKKERAPGVKRGRKPDIDLEKLERGIELVLGGMTLRRAQEVAGVSRSAIARHMRARGLATPPSTRSRAGAAA